MKGLSIPCLSGSIVHHSTKQHMPTSGHVQPVLVAGDADQAGDSYCSLSLLVMDGRHVTPLANGMQHWMENQASEKCSQKQAAFVKHQHKAAQVL